MTTTYDEMWKSLGLDLEAHAALLDVLGKAYGQIFMTQKDRPKGMEYFDFVMSEVHGLRIKELMDAKAEGRKVVGTYCVFVPEEFVLALDGVMVGLCAGADFAGDKVDQILPRNTCALIKSAFGFKLGKVCPYLEAADVVVGENTCDGKKKAYEHLKDLVHGLYVMDLPQMKTDDGRALLRNEYRRFIGHLEGVTGTTMNAQRLKKGIRAVNAKRRVLHRLARLREADPTPISGLDALLVNQVSFYDDPTRFTESVGTICDELEARVAAKKGVAAPGTPRILLSGCPMAVPNWKVPAIVEGAGAVIVGEESCIGERGSRNLVADTGSTLDELLDAVVDRYFDIDCAVFTPNPSRMGHIEELVEATRADGVIHYSLQFCQPYQMEAMAVEKNLEAKGRPILRLDTDYSQEDVEQLTTRVEAFVEQLRQ